ncbi:MAG: oxaloacetate decarboxylase, partial [Alphaproteobacteria bacterium]
GIAGVHIEDQVLPKKCGAFPNRTLVSKSEMIGKIHAAVDARRDHDFVLIARTDAVASPGGMPETIDRGLAYIEAGADLVLVQIPRTVQEITETCQGLPGKAVLTISENKVAPVLTFAEYEKLGLKLGLLPLSLTFCAVTAMRKAARSIKETASIHTVMKGNDGWDSVLDLVQLPKVLGWSEKYAEPIKVD